MSIFLISPYSIAASQDKAISQNVINIAANHKEITRTSDLLHPQELLCLVLDKILDLCRLQFENFTRHERSRSHNLITQSRKRTSELPNHCEQSFTVWLSSSSAAWGSSRYCRNHFPRADRADWWSPWNSASSSLQGRLLSCHEFSKLSDDCSQCDVITSTICCASYARASVLIILSSLPERLSKVPRAKFHISRIDFCIRVSECNKANCNLNSTWVITQHITYVV